MPTKRSILPNLWPWYLWTSNPVLPAHLPQRDFCFPRLNFRAPGLLSRLQPEDSSRSFFWSPSRIERTYSIRNVPSTSIHSFPSALNTMTQIPYAIVLHPRSPTLYRTSKSSSHNQSISSILTIITHLNSNWSLPLNPKLKTLKIQLRHPIYSFSEMLKPAKSSLLLYYTIFLAI